MYMRSCDIGECGLEVVCTRDVSECEVYCLVCGCVLCRVGAIVYVHRF